MSLGQSIATDRRAGRLTADNEVGLDDEPVAFDCNTPDVSQHENYPWSPQDIQTLSSHLHYYDEMKHFVSLAIRDGPDVFMIMPKQPRPSLKSVFVRPRPKQNLLGVELHEYLQKHLVNCDANIQLEPWNPVSLDSVKTSLQTHFHVIKQHHARAFNNYMQYGKMLNAAYDFFSVHKLRGNLAQDMTWAQWLKDNVGISITYSKQLRSIAKDFGVYTGFNYLGISFSEFLKRKEHIRLMFAEFSELDQYWRNFKP